MLIGAGLNSLKATTLKPARSSPRVSPPHPEKSEIAFGAAICAVCSAVLVFNFINYVRK